VAASKQLPTWDFDIVLEEAERYGISPGALEYSRNKCKEALKAGDTPMKRYTRFCRKLLL
jgi:hypothetical protein